MEPLSSTYAGQFGATFATAPLGSVLGSAAAAAAGKQVEGIDSSTNLRVRPRLCLALFSKHAVVIVCRWRVKHLPNNIYYIHTRAARTNELKQLYTHFIINLYMIIDVIKGVSRTYLSQVNST